jgi:hypothetical protein
MIKNIILSFILLISSINNSFSQDLQPISLETTTSSEEFVTQHKDVEIVIGDLKIKAPFLYKGETTPKQGYIVDIRDTIRIKDIVEGCQSSCDILVKELTNSYNNKISVCQDNCNIRIDQILKEKKVLVLEVSNLKDEVKKEIRSKYVWAVISSIAGAGIGILVYEISR